MGTVSYLPPVIRTMTESSGGGGYEKAVFGTKLSGLSGNPYYRCPNYRRNTDYITGEFCSQTLTDAKAIWRHIDGWLCTKYVYVWWDTTFIWESCFRKRHLLIKLPVNGAVRDQGLSQRSLSLLLGLLVGEDGTRFRNVGWLLTADKK